MMSFTMDDKGVRSLVKKAEIRAGKMRPVMEDFAAHMEGSIEENFRAGGRPTAWEKSSGEKTLVKSTRLKNSVTGEADNNGVKVGSNVRYGKIHHYGGVIKPKTAKALAIPLQSWIKAGPKRYSGLSFMPPQNGDPENLGVLGKKKKQGRGKKRKTVFVGMFALRSSVTIKARPWLMFQAEDLEYVKHQIRSFVERGAL